MMSERVRQVLSIAFVLLVAAVGVALAFQGWNARLMNFDFVNFIDAAAKLREHGVLPDRGDVSSYWAWATPGTAWLLVPGMLVFDDPRLFEAVGSVGLFVGTLAGVFLIARACFGLRCALLAVLLYGLSRNGLFYAGSLWSIGHPFFYVWTVYLALLWVRRSNSNYLAAAVLIWAIGMYVDMVIAPVIFVVPVLWAVYRPPIRIVPQVVAAVLIAAVWYPYLRFEHERDFADLRALVTRERLSADNYKESWCSPTLVAKNVAPTIGQHEHQPVSTTGELPPKQTQSWYAGAKAWARLRVTTLREGARFNFDQMTWTPTAALPLFALSAIAILFVAAESVARLRIATNQWWSDWLQRLAWVLLIAGVLANEVVIARFLSTVGTLASSTVWEIRLLQASLILPGVALLTFRGRAVRLLTALSARSAVDDGVVSRRVFVLGVLVPWLVTCLVAEPGNATRHFWLWPLQSVLIAAVVTYVPKRLGSPRGIAALAQAVVTLLLLTHPWLVSPVGAWATTGWAGNTPEDIRAVDYIAGRLRAERRDRAAVGYQTFFAGFMPQMNVVDRRYKVGAELDLLLEHGYGIVNTSRCAEGISSDDEYRIVQSHPPQLVPIDPRLSLGPIGGEVKTHRLFEHFDIPRDPSFQLLRQFGDFQIFRRSPRLDTHAGNQALN